MLEPKQTEPKASAPAEVAPLIPAIHVAFNDTKHDYNKGPFVCTIGSKPEANLIAASIDMLHELGGIADALKYGEVVTILPGSVKAKRIADAIAIAEGR